MRAHLELLQGCVEHGGNYPLSRGKKGTCAWLKRLFILPQHYLPGEHRKRDAEGTGMGFLILIWILYCFSEQRTDILHVWKFKCKLFSWTLRKMNRPLGISLKKSSMEVIVETALPRISPFAVVWHIKWENLEHWTPPLSSYPRPLWQSLSPSNA